MNEFHDSSQMNRSTPADGAGNRGLTNQPGIATLEHVVQFYEADSFLLDSAATFISAGLRAGEIGIVFATPAHRMGLDERLRADGLDLAGALARGQYIALDAAEALADCLVAGMPDSERFNAVVGSVVAHAARDGRRMRVFGDLVALLAAEGEYTSALRLEEYWNDLQRTYGFLLLCGYPMNGFSGEALAEPFENICAQHSSVVPAESYAALTESAERLRAVARLQQKTAFLEGEVAQRKMAEALLTGQKRVLAMIAGGVALTDVLTELTRMIEAQSDDDMLCSILVRDAEHEQFCLGIAPSMPDSFISVLANASILPPYLGPCGRATHMGEDVITSDIAVDECWADEWRQLALSHGLRTCASSPIFASDGTVLGSVAMYYRASHGPRIANRQLVEVATHLAGLAIERDRAETERARLLSREREARTETETLYRVGQALSAELDLESMVQAATDAATRVSGAQFGAFFYNVVNDQGESFMLYTLSGISRAAFDPFPMPRNTEIFGPTFRGERVVRFDDVTQDPRYGNNPPYHGMPEGHPPVRSHLAVPVVSRSGEVLGGLFFGHAKPGVFSERAERLVAGIAAQAAVAMDNARLYQQVQGAVSIRDQFLATVAHDLRTPLTTIRGHAQILRRRITRANPVPDSRLGDGLAKIETTTTKMSAMINELLDVTLLELGEQLTLEREPIDLVALARRAAAEYQQTTERHRIRVEAAETEVVGLWDGARLERVIDNLVNNAVKFSPEGGEVVITVARPDDASNWAALAVQDQGFGIPVEDLPRIFGRFHRGQNVAERIAGIGIGLVGVRKIVELHGGTVAVASREGTGSTFTVRLPLRP